MSLVLLNKDRLETPIDYTKVPKRNFVNTSEEIVHYINEVIAKKQIKILILRSGTGTGKSTVLPVDLYKANPNSYIIVAEPTTMSAKEIAEQIAIYNADTFELGKNLGYITGGAKRRQESGIKFCTFGVLSLETTRQNFGYNYVLLDEAHTNTKEKEEVLYKLKQLSMRENSPVIIFMSGTIDTETFKEYLNVDDDQVLFVKNETSFPIEEVFLHEKSDETQKKALERMIDIFAKPMKQDSPDKDNNHVLIFENGIPEIKRLVKSIETKYKDILLPIGVYGDLVRYKDASIDILQESIADKPHIRKIVIATNVIETGVTVDGLRYVIDSGISKTEQFNPIYGIKTLVTCPIDEFSRIQRKGRVGRKQPGFAFPLYKKSVAESLVKKSYSSVVTKDITRIILDYLVFNEHEDPSKLLFIDLLDKIPIQSLAYSLKTLLLCGAIDRTFKVTIEGKIAHRLYNLDNIQSAMFVLFGIQYTNIHVFDLIKIVVLFENAKTLFDIGDVFELQIPEYYDVIEKLMYIFSELEKEITLEMLNMKNKMQLLKDNGIGHIAISKIFKPISETVEALYSEGVLTKELLFDRLKYNSMDSSLIPLYMRQVKSIITRVYEQYRAVYDKNSNKFIMKYSLFDVTHLKDKKSNLLTDFFVLNPIIIPRMNRYTLSTYIVIDNF